MTATIAELRPKKLQADGGDPDLHPKILAAYRMAMEAAEEEEAFRKASPKFKLVAWVSATLVSVMLWWMIVKLVMMGWGMMAF
jgi:hypothetical protein